MTITPTTISGALEAIDSEVAVLIERRRLLAELLATFSIDGWVAVERPAPDPAINERFAIVDAEPKSEPTPKAPKGVGGRKPKWDYAEVTAVIVQGVEAGKTATGALTDHYGVNKGMAGFLMKRCRELGLTRDARPFTAEPMARTSFDAEAARDRSVLASIPKEGKGGGAVAWQPEPRKQPATPEPPAPKFTVDDAVAALETAS